MGHGGQIDELAKSAGINPEELIDLSASINPHGFPEWTRTLMSRHLESVQHYPDLKMKALTEAACLFYKCTEEELYIGNGSSEILYQLPRVLKGKRVLIPTPAYIDYAHAFQVVEWEVAEVNTFNSENGEHQWEVIESSIREHDVIVLGHPINPTGSCMEKESLLKLIESHPTCHFVVDEAFADFMEPEARVVYDRPVNVSVLCSLTKSFAIPGLRLGAMVADSNLVSSLKKITAPWSVNSLAMEFGNKALRDTSFLKETRQEVSLLKEHFFRSLKKFKHLEVCKTKANYVLVKSKDALAIGEKLLSDAGIAIRNCKDFHGLNENYFRVAITSYENQSKFIRVLENFYKVEVPSIQKKKSYKLMIQGTASNAGKSLITAALCRLFMRKGLKVAPFKSQNMSLNACVCSDGLEMARAQMLQAYACQITPQPEMNPILLKPEGFGRSQVVVMGENKGAMSVKEYHAKHQEFFQTSLKAFRTLSDKSDLVIMEGAGSIAEINLRSVDIVNMPMARAVNAPVMLVGNIDLGGVYASLAGSLDLLPEADRKLIKGFLVNRFRGDASLLEPAHERITEHTRKPFLGVIPFLDHLRLPEEDSVGFSNPKWGSHHQGDVIDIVVIDVGYASNINDFEPLLLESDINIRKVKTPDQLGSPDVIILPGSKNVFESLNNLKLQGLIEAIQLCKPIELIGICGGMSMMSKTLKDLKGYESGQSQEAQGMGFLELNIEWKETKTLLKRKLHWPDFNLMTEIYEMHQGQITKSEAEVIASSNEGEPLAWKSSSQSQTNYWGTWCHGLFDNDVFRRAWINKLREQKGLPISDKMQTFSLEKELDRWADHVEEHVDIEALWKIISTS